MTRQIVGVSSDSRTIKPGELFVAITGLNQDGHRFIRSAVQAGAAATMVERSNTVPHDMPEILVKNTLDALGRIANGYRWRPPLIPWVAVTGSNGKTTTRELLALMLQTRGKVRTSQRNWNNSIGLPLSMMSPPDDAWAAILEMGTNHPGEIAHLREIAVPTVGIVTSTGASHLEGFGSLRAVVMEKAAIFGWLPQDGLAIYPAYDPNHDILRAGVVHNHATFSLDDTPADLSARDISLSAEGSSFLVEDVRVNLPLLGVHNISNFLAALLAARYLGIELETAAAAVARAKPVPGRLQCLVSPAGIQVINDSYNANPDSMLAAIDVLMDIPASRKIAVLGDMLELGEESRRLHREVGLEAAIMGVDAIFATGSESVAMAEAAQANAHIIVRHFPSHEALWTSLRNFVRPGDLFLVKGSRGMHMERLVNELMEWR
jgi:UDP-N-acetylmuramoyl-tripeptide--D-alanyl-D-alanine ligase